MSLLHYWETQRSVKRRRISENETDLETNLTEKQPPSPSPSSASGVVDTSTPVPFAEEPDAYIPSSQTELETALPVIQTGVWERGKSSIYVDAFNLALETVLDEESHLFNEAEIEVFQQWKDLSYESQYLYVRLFLRKTSAWHRINRLGYYSDISDLSAVATDLQRDRILPKNKDQDPSFRFADGTQEITTLEEASSLLLLDELKGFAKEVKAQGKNKKELLAALCETSQSQTGLVGFKDEPCTNQPGNRDGHPRGKDGLPAIQIGDCRSSPAKLLQKILDYTGQCIRLTPGPRALFERVHLVFYRSTEWTEKSLTTIILAKISRRNFPQYIVCRSNSIFSSRAALLEFESAIRTQFEIDNILEFNGSLQRVIDLADEFYPRWRALVDEEQRKQDSFYSEGAYLRRFSPAWVYTRIIHKSLLPLGRFKEYKREHELLTELLAQRFFHASRRGAWYQRKALLEEHYMWALIPTEVPGRNEENQRKFWKRVALRTCEEGLEDPLCHIIYHYDLQKRITKLEKALRVVKREQHDFGHVMLSKPFERTIEGIRIDRGSKKGKATIWIDEREGGECRVESMCLSWYRDHGWKGYHSEGGIVRTLFGLLFYDILFTYVPNVFQTPFQTCPLDLHTDVFYLSRASEINHRLVEITNGAAERLIREIHDRESPTQPCAIGIDWSLDLDDLLEIVQCFRGEALATICKVMAQEYQQRGGGMPDLLLWSTEKKSVLFAEVKSENDRLSDTQRLWIHILLGAGVQVELCNAVAREVRTD